MKWTNSLRDTICQNFVQKEIDYLNDFISITEVESIIN